MINKNFTIIALGSNLGNRYNNILKTLNILKNNLFISKCSSIYESNAVLPKNAPKNWHKVFYNCVFCAKTNLNCQNLLKLCESIENKIAKKKRNKGSFEPRYIDIDILAFNDDVIKSEKLLIPHEKMTERDFVMLPLLEILPEWEHPVLKKNVAQLTRNFKPKNKLNKLDLKLL